MFPLVLFAPGAGAPSSSPWMRAWAARLGSLGRVAPIDYPYALLGRRRPDPLPRLIAAHRAALAVARTDGAVVLAGKSMGGRVGCHVALVERIDALVCLGYPLRGATGKRRDEVLLALRTPVLFVQGTRDALCPLADLEEVRGRMAAPSTLHVVEEGDHSLRVTATELRRHGETQDAVDARTAEAIAEFLRRAL